jgi:hypothetical protein
MFHQQVIILCGLVLELLLSLGVTKIDLFLGLGEVFDAFFVDVGEGGFGCFELSLRGDEAG